MSYENAPATRLLATSCAVCGRPLVDSVSVDIGMGPDCRKRHGLEDVKTGRDEANRIVHQLALRRSNHELAPDATTTVAYLRRLDELGYQRLAGVLVDRLVKVRVKREGHRLLVFTPIKPAFISAVRQLGAWWDWSHKAWRLDDSQRRHLWTVLKTYFPGEVGRGPDGLFPIETRPKPVQLSLVSSH